MITTAPITTVQNEAGMNSKNAAMTGKSPSSPSSRALKKATIPFKILQKLLELSSSTPIPEPPLPPEPPSPPSPPLPPEPPLPPLPPSPPAPPLPPEPPVTLTVIFITVLPYH